MCLKMYYDIISLAKGRSVSSLKKYDRMDSDVESEEFGGKVLPSLYPHLGGGSVFFFFFDATI